MKQLVPVEPETSRRQGQLGQHLGSLNPVGLGKLALRPRVCTSVRALMTAEPSALVPDVHLRKQCGKAQASPCCLET